MFIGTHHLRVEKLRRSEMFFLPNNIREMHMSLLRSLIILLIYLAINMSLLTEFVRNVPSTIA